jgi:PAB1-binding protein PBP1
MLNLNAFMRNSCRAAAVGAFAVGAIAFSGAASAAPQTPLFPFFLLPPAEQYAPPPAVEAAPAPDQSTTFELPARLRRQVVSYTGREARQPYLPRHMAGGPGNPLGARAMYLGGTVYRIHGTNAPETIGTHVSSGCIRLTNEDVSDLYARVNVGTKVIVLPMTERRADLSTSVR